MTVSKAQIKAITKWESNNYFKTLVRLPKDMEELVRSRAEEKGLSLNGYIASLIKADLEKGE